MRATSIQPRCPLFSACGDGFEFRNLVGGPAPHGPEICAVSSTEIDLEGSEFSSSIRLTISGRFRPPVSRGLLHEVLHDSVRARPLMRHRGERLYNLDASGPEEAVPLASHTDWTS
jgi:hypothetical protein